MSSNRTTYLYIIIPIIIPIIILTSSCKTGVNNGTVIFTQEAGGVSRIVAVDGDGNLDIISTGFASACSPDLSYDCSHLLFAGRIKETDVSQIWEMDLRNKKIRQVTTSKSDCFDPVRLPSGQIIVSRQLQKEDQGRQLFICNDDGSGMKQITFDPYNYEDVTLLNDGRLLARRTSGTDAEGMYMVLRPDGTKNMLFYKGTNAYPESRAWIAPDGEIYFVVKSGTTSDIVSISYNRPLHSTKNITAAPDGEFNGVYPSASGKIIVSYKPEGKKNFSVSEFDPANSSFRLIYECNGSDALDPVLVEKKQRQKKLPSEVDTEVLSGQLLCQDVDFTGFDSRYPNVVKSNLKIRISGIDSTLGYVVPEKDGSVYLRVVADTPFRISKIDENGNTVSGPSAWIYLRPNERRGCTGCHEDPELVPRNQLSMAVKKLPVNIPSEIIATREKEVELE